MNSKAGLCLQRVVPILGLTLGLFGLVRVALGSNIDALNRWAWSTNTGWLNFNPVCEGCEGTAVYYDHLEGYAWGENIGWIRLGTHTGGGLYTYGNTSGADYGVNRDSNGELWGYAWGTNVGWVVFDPGYGGVTIDPASGSFDGYAWAENVGWIHFKNAAPAYNVVTSYRPTAVELVSFSATPEHSAILLRWETVSEVDCLGFNIYRAQSFEGPWSRLNEALIGSTLPPGSPEGAVYTFRDETAAIGTTYYRLESVDVYGGTAHHGPATAMLAGFRLYLPLVLRNAN